MTVLVVENTFSELLHPIAKNLNPWRQKYVEVKNELSPNLNPYRNSHEIRISAAITYTDLPHLKTASVFETMRWEYERGLYKDVDTLVVPYGNAAQAAGILARAFGIKRVAVVLPGDEYTALEELDKSRSRVLNVFGHLKGRHIHEYRTGPLLTKAVDGPIGLIAVAMGSCNTVVGLSRYFKRVGFSDTIILGVRPKLGERVPGTLDGAQMGQLVKLPYRKALDELVEVTREEALAGALDLRGEVTPQPGFSSGLAYAGLMKFLSGSSSADLSDLLHGRHAVFVCPDDGRIYPELTPELTIGGTYPSSPRL